MARLPQPFSLTTVTPGAPRPVTQVNVRSAGAVGEALSVVGGVTADIGYKEQDREDTAAAKERDVYLSDEIRKILHDPTAGFTSMYGKNAVAARNEALARLKQLREGALNGLSNGAQKKLETSLTRRMESAKNTIDTHTGTQRDRWLNDASAARIAAAEQDSLLAGPNISVAFKTISSELHQRASREGWDKERLDLELNTAKSSLMYNQAVQMANSNPEVALEYVNKNAPDFLPKDLLKLKGTLEPLAKERAGQRLAQRVFSGNSGYSTKIEFGMGPARPYRPNQPILDVIGSAAEDVFGPGARVMVTSGQEGDQHQHGSNRHKTGDAADIAIFRPDGSRVRATDPDMASFAKAAARRGALGIGFGAEYMGGEHIHVDMVTPGHGQDHTWASGAKAMRGDLVAEMQAPRVSMGNVQDILSEPDPVKRKAALQAYAMMTKAAEGQRKRQLAAASDLAFRHIEAGNSPDDLPLDVRQSLGQDSMSSLRTYYGKIAAGEPVETDPAAYIQLSQMQAQDPAGFQSLNMMDYVDRLSKSDFKSFVDDQNKPLDAVSQVAASTLMSTAKRQMEAAGIDTTPKSGSDEAAQNAAMQARLLRWQKGFISENGRAPTPSEVDERIGLEMVPVVLNPRGILNEVEGFVFDSPDVDPEKLAQSTITIGGVEVPPEVVAEQIEVMKFEGEDVTSDGLVQRLAEIMGRM